MRQNDAQAGGCAECGDVENCACGRGRVAEECCEKLWREQMEREEMETVVRENGIRFAINQHICED